MNPHNISRNFARAMNNAGYDAPSRLIEALENELTDCIESTENGYESREKVTMLLTSIEHAARRVNMINN